MHAARSIGAMKWALLMSKMAVSSSFPFCARNIIDDKKSQQHFKDFSWGHCTEEFMRKQSSICPRAQLSSHKSGSHFWSVCVSFGCHYPLDGNNCDASALCFCSTDFLVESNLFTQRISSIFPACTKFPGSCAPVRSSNSSTHCVADSSLKSKTGSLGDALQTPTPAHKSNHHPTSAVEVLEVLCSQARVHTGHFGQSSIQHDVSVKWRFVAV